MRTTVIIMIILPFIFSCSRNRKAKVLYQKEKHEFVKKQSFSEGEEFVMQYIPRQLANTEKNSSNNEAAMEFLARLNVKETNDFLHATGNGFYKTDSLFYMIHAGDTLWPSYVLPVATGLKNKREYMIAFEPFAGKNGNDEVLIIVNSLKLAYRDIQPFSFKLSKIHNLEKLN